MHLRARTGQISWGLSRLSVPAAAGLLLAFGGGQAYGHGEEGHFAVGYYYGHDGTYEQPANPPWPPTLLVDPHPWELDNVVYDLEPVDSPFLKGWVTQLPGFQPLAVDEQEFNGHEFYSWLDPGYSHGPVHVMLHLDGIDSGLAVLNPDTLQPLAFPFSFGEGFPHRHFTYFVDIAEAPALGTVYTATFHVSDSLGSLAPSEPFTVQFRVVPEPSTLALLGAVLLLSGLRRGRCR